MVKEFLTLFMVGVMAVISALTLVGCDDPDEIRDYIYTDNGDVYALQVAYENGYLTSDDLLSIAYYKQGTNYNEELMGEDYVPKHKDPETLNEKIKGEIIEALKKKTEEDYIEITDYFGTYNNCIIVNYKDGQYYIDVVPTRYLVEIGGVTFSFWKPKTVKLAVYVYEKQ